MELLGALAGRHTEIGVVKRGGVEGEGGDLTEQWMRREERPWSLGGAVFVAGTK